MYYFTDGRRGVVVFAQNLPQARRSVRGAGLAYVRGWKPAGITSDRDANVLAVGLVGDLQRGYDSLVANGASQEGVAGYCREWHFTPACPA